jgi:hypothetical protein
MTAQDYGDHSLDLICEPVAGPGQHQPESAQPEPWQERLDSLQRWICELLIENQQLRMSSTPRASLDLQPIAGQSTPATGTSVA